MEKSRELYHDEITNLQEFRRKIGAKAIFKEDLDDFAEHYEELIAQAKVITRVSDRLQKKLDNANIQIQNQNEEIKDKNQALNTTLYQLAQAKIGRKASTILTIVALVLFVLEQVLLEPIIDEQVSIPYVGPVLLIVIFFVVKFFEGSLESYFLKQEKKKILENGDSLEGNENLDKY